FDKMFGKWRLDGPSALTIKKDSAEIAEACWKNGNSIICGNGRWSKGRGWETSGRAVRISLALAKPWLPEEVALSGVINGSWQASDENGHLLAKTRWTPESGKIEYRTKDGDRIAVVYHGGYFETELENQKLHAETELSLTEHGRVRAD